MFNDVLGFVSPRHHHETATYGGEYRMVRADGGCSSAAVRAAWTGREAVELLPPEITTAEAAAVVLQRELDRLGRGRPGLARRTPRHGLLRSEFARTVADGPFYQSRANDQDTEEASQRTVIGKVA